MKLPRATAAATGFQSKAARTMPWSLLPAASARSLSEVSEEFYDHSRKLHWRLRE